MATRQTKPTFTFFKMLGCGACDQFDTQLFIRLVKDPDILGTVNLEQVTFGHDGQTIYDLNVEFPDLADKIRYAPFLWLSHPYDEKLGYHLVEGIKDNPKLNLRLIGQEFTYRADTTYEILKGWILQTAEQYSTPTTVSTTRSEVFKPATFQKLTSKKKN
jgi:hypothetical protein